MTLSDFYFGQDGVFVIPVEQLTENGIEASFRPQLQTSAGVSDAWLDRFDQALQTLSRRVAELHRKAPRHWLPPRLQNVCVVTETCPVRPYFQPLYKSSWLLYASDFDPATSSVELAAFLMSLAERMGHVRAMLPAFARNLSYFLLFDKEAIADFQRGSQVSTRPDAAAFRTLAEALSWLRDVHHESLRPPVGLMHEPRFKVEQSGLLVPNALEPRMTAVLEGWARTAQQVADDFYSQHSKQRSSTSGQLATWIETTAPRLLVTQKSGAIVWDHELPREGGALRRALEAVTCSAAESLKADLQTIDRHSRAFLDSLLKPEDLPPVSADTEQNGLTYLHRQRKEIAYNLGEADMRRLEEPAPPFERWMVAARTVHEWGHLAAEAGWIPVPESRKSEQAELGLNLEQIFEEIVAHTSEAARSHTAGQLEQLAAMEGSIGAALTNVIRKRSPDFQANLLARRYLSREEMETYIRNNTYSLMFETDTLGLFSRLARYSYEFQYLRFSEIEDPLRYLYASTLFESQYLGMKILSEENLKRLLDAAGRWLDCFQVDPDAFRPEVA